MACDIREPDCQKAVQDTLECLRGGETEMPEVEVISEEEYRALYDEGDDAVVARGGGLHHALVAADPQVRGHGIDPTQGV